MPFREPTPEAVREILLEAGQPRTPTSTFAPRESPRGYLRDVLGEGAEDLSNEERRAVARRLRRGGIATSAIASILHMETVKTTVDRWVDDCTPKTSIGLDGKIRRIRRKKRFSAPAPGPEPLDLSPEAPTPRSVLDALLELRRARIPAKERPDYLRRLRGLPRDASDDQRRETARELALRGFTLSVIAPIVGIPRATVYRWIADVTRGTKGSLKYGIRGTELGTGAEAENLF